MLKQIEKYRFILKREQKEQDILNIGQKLFAINRKYVLFDCFIVLVVVFSFFHNAPIENDQAGKSLFYQTPRDFMNPLDVIYAHPF